MPPAVVVAGLGCGLVVTAGAVMVRSQLRGADRVSQSTLLLTWLAAVLLLAAAAVERPWRPDSSSLASRLFLVAAIVAPLSAYCGRAQGVSARLRALSALALAGSGLAISWAPDGFVRAPDPGLRASLAGLCAPALAVAAGFGIRAASRSVARAVGAEAADTQPGALFGLLAAGVGLMVLSNLWWQGTLGLRHPAVAGGVSAMLAWSAVWILPRRRRVSHAGVSAGAALWLLWVALALI